MRVVDWLRRIFGYETPRYGHRSWGMPLVRHASKHPHRWCEYRTATARSASPDSPSARVHFAYWRHCMDCEAKEWRASRTGHPLEATRHALCGA